jgi:hypothetical protein
MASMAKNAKAVLRAVLFCAKPKATGWPSPAPHQGIVARVHLERASLSADPVRIV